MDLLRRGEVHGLHRVSVELIELLEHGDRAGVLAVPGQHGDNGLVLTRHGIEAGGELLLDQDVTV